MRDEELGVLVPGPSDGGSIPGGLSGSPPPEAGAKVSDLLRSMLVMRGGPDGSGISEETRSALSRLSTAVSHDRDVSRPIGRVRRCVLTTYEFAALDDSPSVAAGSEMRAKLGFPGDARVILWEPRIAAGCYDCLIWSGSFGLVYFGEAVPVHVVVPPAASASAPGPEGIR